jgi:hypothetical protein
LEARSSCRLVDSRLRGNEGNAGNNGVVADKITT